MSQLHITVNLDIDPWVDIQEAAGRGELVHGVVTRVGMLPAGMQSGKAVVAFAGRTDDEKPFVVEIPWAMLQVAARALAATPTAQMEGL